MQNKCYFHPDNKTTDWHNFLQFCTAHWLLQQSNQQISAITIIKLKVNFRSLNQTIFQRAKTTAAIICTNATTSN